MISSGRWCYCICMLVVSEFVGLVSMWLMVVVSGICLLFLGVLLSLWMEVSVVC